jgi:hypothetical protein
VRGRAWLRARTRRRLAGTRLALCALLLLGCAAPHRGAAAVAERLYVANAIDGTLTQLDSRSGREAGPPLPAGPAPWRIVAGSGGSLLVASSHQHSLVTLGRVSRARDTNSTGWTVSQLPLEPDAKVRLVAGDGGRFAAVAYRAPLPRHDGSSPVGLACRLALVDLLRGEVHRTHTVCGPLEAVGGLALEDGPQGPIAHVGIWPPGRGGRLVSIQMETGAPLASLALAGKPALLQLVPARDPPGRRLYCVENVADVEHDPSALVARRLLALDPATLAPERAFPLGFEPLYLAIAPDGRYAYDVPNAVSARPDVLRLDLATGDVRRLAVVGGSVAGLAATADRLYLPHPHATAVSAVDVRSGSVVQTIRVGRAPVGVALAG